MLLKALYDLAQDPARGILDDLAFTPRAVRWIIELDGSGRLLGQGPVETGDGKRGREFSCPRTTRNKQAGGVAEFLADGIISVFGSDPDPDAVMPLKKRMARDDNNRKKCADFWRQISLASEELRSHLLKAVLRWRQRNEEVDSFLRWHASQEGKKGCWLVKRSSGGEVRIGADNFTFRVDGRLLLEDEDIRAWWREVHAKECRETSENATRGLCLVSGRADQAIPLTNSKIVGVPGALQLGASLVSFDKDAFVSYGLCQNLNAPISSDAATAYCAAMNWLLNRRDHHLRVGGAVLCFWARTSDTVLFADLLNQPQPDTVRRFMTQPWAGIPRVDFDRDEFCAVTLAGNAGRIAVRHWMQMPLESAVRNLTKWFSDLELQYAAQAAGAASRSALAILELARCTAPLKKKGKALFPDDEKLQALPATILYRAALEGFAPPISMIKSILDQFHSLLVRDEHYQAIYDKSRFSLLKLILNRNRKEADMEIESSFVETSDPAYNCGGLLAVFDALQQSAHRAENPKAKLGSTIAEKYYASASSSPSTAFPILLRLHQHHLKKLRQSGKDAAAAGFRGSIIEIFGRYRTRNADGTPVFPRTLTLVEQARFALGFYQQQANRMKAIQKWKAEQSSMGGTNSQPDQMDVELSTQSS